MRAFSLSAAVLLGLRLGLPQWLQGDVSISRFRDVKPEDLLEREVVEVDDGDLGGFLGGKAVMVTGAGGSIGSELRRQVARFGPSRLLLVERAEGALFNIDRELKAVGDRSRMQALFAEHRPEIVAHAAAHKHVPMMEWHPCEAVKNKRRQAGDDGPVEPPEESRHPTGPDALERLGQETQQQGPGACPWAFVDHGAGSARRGEAARRRSRYRAAW